MITEGGASEKCRRPLPEALGGPSSSTSSSWTIVRIVCAGVSDSRTFAPTARSLVRATNAFAAARATSASISAMRTSRIASLTSPSVTLPRPLRRSKIAPRRSLSRSNKEYYDVDEPAVVSSIRLTASPTVLIFSASSSGMSMLNSVSNAITSSTWSRESAPRSSVMDASGVTSDSSTPSCSTMIFFTLSKVVDISSPYQSVSLPRSPQDPAVNYERLSSNVPGGIRAEEGNRSADVLRLPGSAESGLLDQELPGSTGHLFRHGRFDEARCDGVDSYIPRTQLLCQRFAQADEPGLRSGICRLAGVPGNSHDAGHEHDRAGTLLHHRLRDGTAKIEGRF